MDKYSIIIIEMKDYSNSIMNSDPLKGIVSLSMPKDTDP